MTIAEIRDRGVILCIRICIVLFLFISYAMAQGELRTPIMAGSSSLPSTSTTNYSHPFGNLLTWNSTENTQRGVVAVAGTASEFYANVSTVPGLGKSWAFTLVKNGVDTGITCAITDIANSCNDLLTTVSLVPGDTISIKSTPTGTPPGPTQIYFGWVFSSLGGNESILLGTNRSTGMSTSVVQYGAFSGASTPNSTLNLRDSTVPTDGAVSSLHVETENTPGTGKSYQFRLLKNGSSTGLTCTISDSSKTCNDTSNTVTFVAGDTAVVEFTPTGTPTSTLARWSMKWVSDTAGASILSYSSGNNLNTGGSNRFSPPSASSNTWQSTEINAQVLVPGSFWLKDLVAGLNNAPGAGSAYTLRTRVNASVNNINATISDANTSGSDLLNSDVIAAEDKLAILAVSSGSVATTQARFGIVVMDTVVVPPPSPTPTPSPSPSATPMPTPTPGTNLLRTPIMAGGTTLPSTSSVNYAPPFGNLMSWSSTENNQRSIISVYGTASDFYATVGVAPGTGKSWTFNLVKNGVATGVTCTISGNARTCSDLTNEISLEPGDTVSIKSTPTGNPTGSAQMYFGWVFESVLDNESILLGSNRTTGLSPLGVQYGVLSGASTPNNTLNLRDSIIPTNGSISNLYVELSTSPSTGDSYQFRLLKNGSPTSLTCTISNLATTCNNTASTISFVTGDKAAIEFTPSGASPSAPFSRWSMKWVSDTVGESILSYASGSNMNTSGVARYAPPGGTSNTWQSTEVNAQVIVPGAFWLKDFLVELDTAPGLASAYTFNVRRNSSGIGLTTSISGSNTTGSNTVDYKNFSAGNRLNIISQSSGGVATTHARWGLVVVDSALDPPPIPTPSPSPSPTPSGPEIRYDCTKVTNTNNSGPGSLRACLESTNSNLCVFEISGRIALETDIKVKANKILACQTAPASGAMVTNAGLFIEGSNVRVEHCEIRAGDEAIGAPFDQRRSVTVYAQAGGNIVENVLIQNNSLSWSTDQQISTGQGTGSITRNITFYRNLVYEGLWRSYHSDLTHSTNVLIGNTTGTTSMIRNLFANSRDRNPMLKAGTQVELINNYSYNYGPTQNSNLPRIEYNVAKSNLLDFIGNYCKNGPRSFGTPYCLYANPLNLSTSIYMLGNKGPTRTQDDQPEEDIAYSGFAGMSEYRVINRTTTGILNADDVLADIVANAGARPWNRVEADRRVINDVQSGGTLGAHYDCVATDRCDIGDGELQVPEGGFPTRPVEIRSISCAADYSEAQYDSWIQQFESNDPIPTPTPPVGGWYDRFLLRKTRKSW